MTAESPTIVIIGGGLAGHTAAAVLCHKGVSPVIVSPESAGATGLWRGAGQVFGPIPHRPGTTSAGKPESLAELVSPPKRWTRLRENRPWHPYHRLVSDLNELRTRIDDALGHLDYDGVDLLSPPRLSITDRGIPCVADLAPPSLVTSRLSNADSVAVVAEGLESWSRNRIPAVTKGFLGARSCLVRIGFFEEQLAPDAHPVHAARIVAERSDDFIQSIAKGLSELDTPPDYLLCPPCLGPTWQSHRTICHRIEDRLDVIPLETASSTQSVHGHRLVDFLRTDHSDLNRLARVNRGTVSQGRVTGVDLDEQEPLRADAVILATGKWVSEGIDSDGALSEPLFDLPLWLDGDPVDDPDSTWPPELMGTTPSESHPLLRVGLHTGERMRPLDGDGEPVYSNLFACGRILAGSNPISDGTDLGVDLVTGLAAAESLIETIE